MSQSIHQHLIDLSDTNPLLPSNQDYTTPTLPLIPTGPDVVLENPYTEIEIISDDIPIAMNNHSVDEGPNSIVCMFVVLFHVTRGHEIIWSLPEELNLDGVELKAVPSGMHTVERDFIYFRKAGLFGLSCFAKRAISSQEDPDQRGARMMALGILCLSPDHLPPHLTFLSTTIQNLLDAPNDFSFLIDYYNSFAYNPTTNSQQTNQHISNLNLSILSSTTGGHDFARFIQILGPSVFVLWKYLLIQSRVIFFSKPPIGPCCNWVYFSCLLTQSDYAKINPNPHFYVSVADLDILKEENNFIACTTEQILQIKRACYDVFIPLTSSEGEVTGAKINCPGVMIKPILFINNTDINRYRTLMKRCECRGALLDREQLNLTCIQYFREINNQLFSHFSDYSQYESIINPHLLKRAGIDTYGDFTFLRNFCRTYNMKVTLHGESEFSALLCCSPRGSIV
ncbi:Protein LCHN-like [Oopsacas minuta]|uniref:Protein LCHN-like n=1 Tax=Oopsacas minuta TaxID=111878 RepID=A0AAV7JW77_9METZ|nr:Protein LCHN-like [Oopsacas minuta]